MKLAQTRHQSGDVAAAIKSYEFATLLEPGNFDAHYPLGILKAQSGDLQSALLHFGRAHLLERERVEFLNHYALAAGLLDQTKLAVSIFEEIAQFNDSDVQTSLDFALALKRSGEFGRSLQTLRRAIALDPSQLMLIVEMASLQCDLNLYSDALNSFANASQIAPTFLPMLLQKGIALEKVGSLDEAILTYHQILDIEPGHFIALFNFAHLYQVAGRGHEAYGLYLKVLSIKPDHFETHLNLSALCLLQKDFKNAEKYISQSILLNSDRVEGHFNYGVFCQSCRNLQSAQIHYKNALALDPKYSDAWSNLGDVMYDMQRSSDSISAYRNALVLEPNAAKFHYHLSQALLLDGQFEEGWIEFEWRAELTGASLNQVLQLTGAQVPLWDGLESLKGKRLLVLSEQGLGDVIQFLRFLKILTQQGAILTLVAPQALLSLLEGQSYIHRVIARTDPVVGVDLQCSLMSLPFLLRLDRGALADQTPYIQVSQQGYMYWNSKIKAFQGPRVGLVWSGGLRAHQPQTWAVNQRRNIALRDFLSLMAPGCTYFSLQKGEQAEKELQEIDKGIFEQVDFVDLMGEIRDFCDTASLIESLDLVISVDTSTAHLAAAMGKRVWLLNRYDTCWRWLLNQENSTWYSEMEILRQEEPGDWIPVLMRVKQKLIEWIKSFDRPK